MSQKVRKTLIMIVMAALIICLMAASLTYTFTYGRYTGKDFDAENSPYDDLIEFVGANQYLVYSPEELIQAIKDGYSNIQIADEAEQPFVITEGVTDVTANLVLDVNGKTLIRNSRNPMLDVQTNVSVVLIYDSSDDEQGGFYNPVGSALQASGGTLTVGSGNYDDGPKGTYSDVSQSTSATLVTRNARTDTSYGTPTKDVTGLPKIDKNHYFAEDYTASTGSFNATYIKPDTFLILTYEDDCMLDESGNLITGVQTEGDAQTGKALTVPCNAASCDFYYYYEVGDNPTTSGETETNTYAVIYGYWDVMALARDDLPEGQTGGDGMATALKGNGLIHPYAAVRMEEGEGFARGGQFSNHFDAVNTYGIYAEGGTLTASGANFTTGGNGVCIRVQSAEAEDKTTGGSLTISGGEFSSEIGNTIEMSGGNMTVTNGTFKKSGGKGIGEGNQENEQVANQTAMIDMQGGTLNINGSASNSVTMTAGGTNNGDTLTNVFGILAHSGGEVSVGGCTFNINGNYSAGVLSYDGTINLKDNTFINVTEEHPDGQLTSAGVSSERDTSTTSTSTGSHPINMEGKVTITSNGLGITARGMINVKSGTTTVKTENATGIVVSGDADEPNGEQQATLTVKNGATLSVESTINSSLKWVNAPGHEGTGDTNVNNGIYVENGSIDASDGTLKVKHTGVAGDTPADSTTGAATDAATKSYAVFVKGDAEGGSQETTVSIGAGTITGTKAGGVYVVGTKQGESYTATVTLGGVNVTAQNTYAAGILTETGNVIINGNAHITSSALGIAVINGNVGISADSTDSSVKATRATGVYVRGGTLYNRGTLSVESDLADENNNNLFYQHTGADISTPSTDPNPYNGVYVKGGSLNSTGTLNVTFTGVQNAAFNTETQEGKVNTSYLNQQIKSYAVRVDNGNATIVSGEIKNDVGGGVLVNGGTVNLGAENAANADLTVSTSGRDSDGQNHFVTTDNQWQYDWTLTGGHAVAVEGGTLNIYSGTYTAQMGNGILVRNLASDSTQNTVTVTDGIFEGYNGSGRRVGPGAFYALKVMGGPLILNINGGTFGKALVNGVVPSTNGGAFVMGNPDAKERATVNVTNASFNSYTSDTFAVFRYVDVKFKSSASGNISMTVTKASTDTNNYAAIGVQNDFVYNNNDHPNRGSTITIEDGTYSGGFGIWYGSPMDKVNISGGKITGTSDGILYSASGAVESSLSISGGTFTGYARSGLYFEANPGNNVQLSGGTYKGSNGAINGSNDGRNIRLQNILGANARCGTGSPTNTRETAICTWEWEWNHYSYTQVGKNNGNFTLNAEQVCVNEGSRTRFREFGTVVIDTGDLLRFDG